MKKLLLGVIVVTLLSGCAQMVEEQNRKSNETKLSLMECSEPNLDKSYNTDTKIGFVNQLNSFADSAASFKYVENIRLRTVRLGMMNDNDSKEAISAIVSCTKKQKTKVLDLAQPLFEKIKNQTKDKKEREYLIVAYSEWESYIKNSADNDNQDRTKYDAAISMYKNY
ncbi:hypothetical protein [Proteus mirabilis]|uniref:hypothetical protein n=1 Tax=Proteus mirabilis TaxID=584 RepID=UPI001A33ACE6|nr:hypothetical protein [Proteus mirabilis]MDC6033407.1 hypothetical protein [Proteus mirabilis]MDC6045373.1 hypothetical protein [Proteus mirabilis]MDC6054504.1 hypothetical protein [Proteus mirabilis]MDC6065049.1 hypothetical protein [Proteus mirabilis]HAU5557909.1 hypothetical protein [Proteus mirabilis]